MQQKMTSKNLIINHFFDIIWSLKKINIYYKMSGSMDSTIVVMTDDNDSEEVKKSRRS